MIRAVLSILVIFVCLAHTLDVKTRDDYKNAIEAFESLINSLKEGDFEMAFDLILDEQIRTWGVTLEVLQDIEPQYEAVKKLFEAVKESIPELKAKWLPSTNDIKLFWKYFQKEIEGLKIFHETEDGRKKRKQAVKLDTDYIEHFLDFYNIAEDQLNDRMETTSAMLEQGSGPKFAAMKKLLEITRKMHTESKAKWLRFANLENRFEAIQKKKKGIKVHKTEVNKNEF